MQINEIKPYPKNAKKHPKKQIEQVAASIKEFGFNQPIVVDKNNVIIVGHGRLEAAKLLGLEDVPVITVDLSEEQAKAYRLADNKLNESDWDMELVIEELKELSADLFDLTGFDKDLLMEPEDKDDVIPGMGDGEPRTKPGDVYFLGPHRLVCGDATKEDDVNNLMEGQKADLIFTDPPYNVNYKGQGKNTQEGIMNDNMDDKSFDIFLFEVFKNYAKILKGGGRCLRVPFDLHRALFPKSNGSERILNQESAHLEQANGRSWMGRLPMEARAVLLCWAG